MKLRVAIIGCGAIAELRHAPEYRDNPDVEIAAFCDAVPARALELANRFGGQACSDIEQALRIPDLHAVSICTANNTHAAFTIQALRAGKHVLCEKPMTTNLADAHLMLQAARLSGKLLMVGHNQRLAPVHAKARELLASGTLGRVLTVKTTFGHGGPETWSKDKGAGTWFFQKNKAALGALGDLGIHKADLIRYLLDDEIDEVYAAAGTLHKTFENGQPIDVEDNAVCVLKSRRGILGTLCASWTYYGQEDNSTVLYCEHGILRILCEEGHPLVLQRRDGSTQSFDVGDIQTNASQTSTGVIDAFVRAIQRNERPPVSGEDGFEALSIALACSQSARSGRSVCVSHCCEPASDARPQRPEPFDRQGVLMETNFIAVKPRQWNSWDYCGRVYTKLLSGKTLYAQGESLRL